MKRRYRVSGMIKFSDDHLIFDNQTKDIFKDMFKDIYLEVGGLCMNTLGTVEMIEEKVEDLGPGSWDEDLNYITTCKCEDCKAARVKAPETERKEG